MNAPAAVQFRKSERSQTTNTPSEIRTAYPFFHEKRTKNSAGVPFVKKDGTPNPRYSSTFMFPKLSSDPYQCANYIFLYNLAQEAAKKMWPTNVDHAGNWVWPQGAHYAVKDGDVPISAKPKPGQPLPSPEEIAKKNAWRKGHWIVEVENFLDPGPRIAKVVNGAVQELPAKTINGVAMYKSGDFGFANIHAYAYERETFGVNFGFDGFCFTREGELIGSNAGPRSAAQMFGGIAGTAVSPAPAAPGVGPAAAAPPSPPMPPQPQQYAPPAPPTIPSPPVAPAAPVAPVAAVAAPPMPPGLPPFPGR